MRKWIWAGAFLAVLSLVGCKAKPEPMMEDVTRETVNVQGRIESLQAEMARVAEKEAFTGYFFRSGTVEGAWAFGTDLVAVVFNPGTRMYEAHLLDLMTGRPRWMVVLGDLPLRFAPEAGDRQVVFLLDQGGGMAVINRLTGARDFLSLTTRLDLIPGGPAVASDGTVYVGSLIDDKLWALNPANGQRGWSFETEGTVVGGPVMSPRLPRRMVVVGTDTGEVFGIPAVAWDAPPPASDSTWSGEILGPVLARPSIATLRSAEASEVSVLVSCEDNGLYCLDVASGAPRWVYRTGAHFIGSPRAAGNKVFANHPTGMRVIDLKTGLDAWQTTPASELPLRYEKAEDVYAADDRRAYLDMGGTHVVRVNAATGEEQAEASLGSFDWLVSAPDTNRLVGVTRDGFVIAYE